MDHAPVLYSDEHCADVVITCPPSSAKGLAKAIRKRGNIPLDIDGLCLAELPAADLKESWNEARKLKPHQIAALTKDLGQNLSDHDRGLNLDSKVGEAAAFFLLALRHHHITPKQAMAGCRVTYHANSGIDEVDCLS
jgi:hypothetical protein